MVLTLYIIFVSVEVCSMNIELTDQLGFLSCDYLVFSLQYLNYRICHYTKLFFLFHHFHLGNGNLNSSAHELIENILSTESQNPKHII